MLRMNRKPVKIKMTPKRERGCIPACLLDDSPLMVNNVIPQNKGIIKERTYEKYIQNMDENMLLFIIFGRLDCYVYSFLTVQI